MNRCYWKKRKASKLKCSPKFQRSESICPAWLVHPLGISLAWEAAWCSASRPAGLKPSDYKRFVDACKKRRKICVERAQKPHQSDQAQSSMILTSPPASAEKRPRFCGISAWVCRDREQPAKCPRATLGVVSLSSAALLGTFSVRK